MNTITGGITVDLHIGQRVLIRDREFDRGWSSELRRIDRTQLRVGEVRSLGLEDDGAGGERLMVHVRLERPIILRAFDKYPAQELWHQHVPTVEVMPYTDVDEILDALRELTFAARTAGAPVDPALGEAIAAAEVLLDRYTEKGEGLAVALTRAAGIHSEEPR